MNMIDLVFDVISIINSKLDKHSQICFKLTCKEVYEILPEKSKIN